MNNQPNNSIQDSSDKPILSKSEIISDTESSSKKPLNTQDSPTQALQNYLENISKSINEPKQILFEDQNEQTDPKATLSRLIEGQLVQLSNCYFIDKNKVMITIDGKEYAYSRTKEYKDAVYFQCVNRNRTESLGNKYKAKVITIPNTIALWSKIFTTIIVLKKA